MPVKSVIDIEVNDQRFARFLDLYKKYEEALAKQPAAWKQAAGATGLMGQQFQRMTSALLAQNHLHHEIANEEDRQNVALAKSQRLWTSIGSTVRGVASSLGHATLSLAKWGAILGGAGSVFSLYGIGRAIEGVSDSRREAMGLSLSIGQKTSFGINFSRLLNTGQYLSWVAGMEQDVTQQAPFYALTGRGASGNTERDAMAMLMAVRRLARTTPLGLLGPEFSALGVQMSPEDIRRFASMGNTEFARLVAGNRADIGKTNVPDNIAMGWSDFSKQLKLAGSQIEKTFVIGLAPLQGPLTRLSGSIVHVLEVAMRKNGLIEQGIGKLAKYLDEFNGRIGKPAFVKSVEQFTSDVGTMAKAVHWLTHEVTLYAGWRHPGHEFARGAKSAFAAASGFTNGAAGLPMLSPNARQMSRADILSTSNKLDALFGFPAGTMRRLVATESGFNPNATSSKGAMGLTQLMPDTAWNMGLRGNMAYDPMKNLVSGAEYLSRLVRQFGGNMQQALAAYNWGPQNVRNDIAQHGSNWLKFAPKETRNYVVRVENATGGSAVVASAGLGAQ